MLTTLNSMYIEHYIIEQKIESCHRIDYHCVGTWEVGSVLKSVVIGADNLSWFGCEYLYDVC